MGKSVSHYTDGRSAWKLGVNGLLVRYRGIAVAFAITVLFPILIAVLFATGFPWWWSVVSSASTVVSSASIDLKLAYVAFGLVLILGLGFTCLQWYLRKRTMRSQQIKYYLHQLTHDIRDKQTELHEKLSPSERFSRNELNRELELLLTEICENAGTHFKLLTGDEGIGVAIRLASLEEDECSIVYKTYARSRGLNPNRRTHSEPIPTNTGIPRYLREQRKAQGVLIYHDLEGAKDDGTYNPTRTDELYPHEIITMMVAPLNAWSGTNHDMIGIMYVTSRRKKTFKQKHVDTLLFISDLAASAVANTIELVRLKCQNPELNKGGEHGKTI